MALDLLIQYAIKTETQNAATDKSMEKMLNASSEWPDERLVEELVDGRVISSGIQSQLAE